MGGLSRAKSCFQLSENHATTASSSSYHHAADEDTHLELEPTSLYIKSDDNDKDNTMERLYLPRRGSEPCSLDEYLSRIPRVVSRAQELHAVVEEEHDDGEKHAAAEESQRDNNTSLLKAASSSRCLNVLQGEVAHASALQTDVVVSAEATTCHVVALRSTISNNKKSALSESVPLVSMAHVDKAGVYDQCFDAMLQEHVRHHCEKPALVGDDEQQQDEYGFFYDDDDDDDDVDEPVMEKQHHEVLHAEEHSSFLPGFGLDRRSCSMPAMNHRRQNGDNNSDAEERIEMELHMLGGYLDSDGTSQKLSNSLITTFSQLADKYRDKMHISLSTAAISCMNTSELEEQQGGKTVRAPKSRGLGIDTRTGDIFPVKTALPEHLEGPALEIRSARAWATTQQQQHQEETTSTNTILSEPNKKEELHVIHDTTSENGQVRVAPFRYEPLENLNVLLHVPDDVLLKVTSTSPECESDRFCNDLRRTLSFLNTVPPETVFGDDCSRPLVYSRSASNLNEWELIQQHDEPTTL